MCHRFCFVRYACVHICLTFLCAVCCTLNREELLLCLGLNPLAIYFLWTAGVVHRRHGYLCTAYQVIFSYVAIFFYVQPVGTSHFYMAMLLPMALCILAGFELKKGSACSRTLYLVSA